MTWPWLYIYSFIHSLFIYLFIESLVYASQCASTGIAMNMTNMVHSLMGHIYVWCGSQTLSFINVIKGQEKGV